MAPAPAPDLELADDGTARAGLASLLALMGGVGLLSALAGLGKGNSALAGFGVGVALVAAAAVALVWRRWRMTLRLDGQGLQLRRPFGRTEVRAWSQLGGWKQSKFSGQLILLDLDGKASLSLETQWQNLPALLRVLEQRWPSLSGAEGRHEWKASRWAWAGWALLFALLAAFLALALSLGVDGLPLALILAPLLLWAGVRFRRWDRGLSLEAEALAFRGAVGTERLAWMQVLEVKAVGLGLGNAQLLPILRLAGGGLRRLPSVAEPPAAVQGAVQRWLTERRRAWRPVGTPDLAACEAALAAARGRPKDWRRWRPAAPGWMGDRMDHPLAAYLGQAQELWRRGGLSWGHLAQPNPLLLRADAADCAGILLLPARPDLGWAGLARAVKGLSDGRDEPIFNAAKVELDADFAERAEKRGLRACFSLFSRAHWPVDVLCSPWFPVLSLPEGSWAMVLPHGLWPPELQQRWIAGE